MSSEIPPTPTTDDASWFHKLKKRFVGSKEEPTMAIGTRFKIINSNTRQVMVATLTRIDPKTGQVTVHKSDFGITYWRR